MLDLNLLVAWKHHIMRHGTPEQWNCDVYTVEALPLCKQLADCFDSAIMHVDLAEGNMISFDIPACNAAQKTSRSVARAQ